MPHVIFQERELERQREVLELVYLLRQISDEEVRNAFISGAAVATVRRRPPTRFRPPTVPCAVPAH